MGLSSTGVTNRKSGLDHGKRGVCQRCLMGKEARYRAYTDVMEIDICRSCAAEARRLGIPLASLVSDGQPSTSSKAPEYKGVLTGNAVATKRSPDCKS